MYPYKVLWNVPARGWNPARYIVPLGLNQNCHFTVEALLRVGLSEILTSRFRSAVLNPDRCAGINSGNEGRSCRLHCFL